MRGPDEFFTAEQQQRLGELMAMWRLARDQNIPLAGRWQSELETLVQVELQAAGRRAAALIDERASESPKPA